jgi:antitoxin component of RelBE/YafQ-DinJ toxin-antitoxin module
MKGTVTIRIDEELERRLEQVCARSGMTRSDVVRESLRRQLSLMQFEQIRERVVPLAEARGYQVDEDVFREVS